MRRASASPGPGQAHESVPGTSRAWTQLLLAAVLMLATLPGRTQGLGLVTEPLLADLRLDRVTYASLNLISTLLGALCCFPAGWAIDRLGLRWVTGVVTLCLGLAVWQFSLLGAGMVLLFVFLLATRAFGQSALSVCSITTVGKRFAQRAGIAMGVYSVLFSVFFAIAFVAVGYSVRTHGWRAAWLQIAFALLFGVTPLAWLFLREPRLPSTGSTAVPHQPASPSPDSTGAGFTFAAAIRTPAFWLFAGAAASFNLVSSGLGLFNEAVLAEHGIDQKSFHLFLGVSTLMSLLGQLACGWLTLRFTFQTLTWWALSLYAAGLAAIPFLQAPWQLWPVALLLGVAGGMIIVIFFTIWSVAFGQRHLGRIQGAAQMLTVVSSGFGPVLFAKGVERFHSYTPLLLVLAGAVLILGLVAKVIRLPDPATWQSNKLVPA